MDRDQSKLWPDMKCKNLKIHGNSWEHRRANTRMKFAIITITVKSLMLHAALFCICVRNTIRRDFLTENNNEARKSTFLSRRTLRFSPFIWE